MQVNAQNAASIALVYDVLADARYSMRTMGAVRKSTIIPPETANELSGADILNVAAEAGCTLRTRMRDGAILIQRPATLSCEELRALADRAKAVALGEAPDFEFVIPEPPVAAPEEPGPLDDAMGGGFDEGEDEDPHYN